jgi:putative acetyltransferase
MLYCHPDHAGRGLAAALLAETEICARAAQITCLFTEASELARPVFERAGFAVLHRHDFTIGLPEAPVAIHNYAMEKRLR